MRKILMLAAMLVTMPALADVSPLVGIYNADNVLLWPGLLTYPACGSSCAFRPMGIIYTTSAAVATASGTTEQVLGTYSLPANALDQAGRRLRITAQWTTAANTNNKTAKLYFGSASLSSGTVATSAAGIFLTLEVVKSGSSTQIVTARGQAVTTSLALATTAATEDDTAAIVIKATSTDGTSAASDMVLQDFKVEYMN